MALTTVTENLRRVQASVLDEVQEQEYYNEWLAAESKIQEDELLKALGDECARAILLSLMDEPKSAIDVTRENKIPLSSVYRKIHWLENARLIRAKGFVITDGGKKYHLYQSMIRRINISFREDGIRVEFTDNNARNQ